MPERRITARRNTLERRYPDVFNDLVQGKESLRALAAKYGVSHTALTKFKVRNAEALNAAMAEVTRYAAGLSIADKQYRLSRAQADFDAVTAWLQEHTLTERTVRYDRDGNEVGETIRLRKDALDMLRAYRREVAEELGQLPKTSDTTINNNLVLIRQYNGETEAI